MAKRRAGGGGKSRQGVNPGSGERVQIPAFGGDGLQGLEALGGVPKAGAREAGRGMA